MSFRRDILDDDDPMAGLDFAIHGNEGAGLAATDLNAVLSPLQQLIRYWQNERYAPDILPSQEITLNALLDHIHRQSDIVQLLRNDPDSSEDEHFRIMLAQIEIERAKFVVRSYVRTRLYKIERYSRLITSDPSLHGRLSKTELSHAQRFAKLTENHFQTAVLNSLPEDQRGLDDDAAFIPPMIPAPNQSHAVFVHAREDCPEVKLPDGNRLDIKRGHIMLTPYSVIDQLLIDDSVELI